MNKLFNTLAVGMSLFSGLVCNANEKLYENFLETGDHSYQLAVETNIYSYYLNNNSKHLATYTQKKLQSFQRMLQDWETIKTSLSQIKGTPKENCPYGKKVKGKNGYTFLRTEWLDRHLISIEREKDKFFWTIGVDQEGNFSKLRNKVKIVDYYHIGTNGNLSDLREALASTEEFFPTPQEKNPNYSIQAAYDEN